MAIQILINIIIAVIWMFLQNSYTVSSFIIGYIIGILLLTVLQSFLKEDLYLIKVWAIVKLILLFAVELIKANIDVIKTVTRPKLDNTPQIIAYPTKLTSNFELTLLASLVSLTPGTITLDFSADNHLIYIHGLDVPRKQDEIHKIKNTFEKAIMEVTR